MRLLLNLAICSFVSFGSGFATAKLPRSEKPMPRPRAKKNGLRFRKPSQPELTKDRYFLAYSRVRAYPEKSQITFMKEIYAELEKLSLANFKKIQMLGHADSKCSKKGGYVCNLVVSENAACQLPSVENKCRSRRSVYDFDERGELSLKARHWASFRIGVTNLCEFDHLNKNEKVACAQLKRISPRAGQKELLDSMLKK